MMGSNIKDQFRSYDVTEYFDDPEEGNSIQHETTIDGQVSDIDITSDDTVSVVLKEVDPDGESDDRVLKSFVGDKIKKDEFKHGISKVSAQCYVTLELVNPNNADSVAMNMTVDEWKV